MHLTAGKQLEKRLENGLFLSSYRMRTYMAAAAINAIPLGTNRPGIAAASGRFFSRPIVDDRHIKQIGWALVAPQVL
jgi:hypothetical protein